MEKTIKKYEELTFTDDYIFWRVMTGDLGLCREVIGAILGREVVEVACADPQEPIEEAPDARGVRLDVYIKGEAEVYSLEMQTANQGDLPKRSRYYQGMIDLDLLERGALFKELKRSFVIFICTFDPFGKGLARYTFRNVCTEEPALELRDGTWKVFVNGRAGNAPGKLGELVRYLSGDVTGPLSRRLDRAVKEGKKSKEWRKAYMGMYMRELEIREEGRVEGRAEGRIEGHAEGRAEILKKMIIRDMPGDLILSLGYTAEEIEAVKESLLPKV